MSVVPPQSIAAMGAAAQSQRRRRFHYEPAPFEPTSQWSFPEAAAIIDLYSNFRPIADNDGFRLVFLEGGAGVGKSTITKRLESMGFTVYHENYVNMCTRVGVVPSLECWHAYVCV
jgi:hypothetical protein